MARATVIMSNELRDRLKREQEFARQVMFLSDKKWCDKTRIVHVESELISDRDNGSHCDAIVEGNTIRFKRDVDMDL